eukprot:CAMPEP_0203765650 /NCGR_PEP_ID=MMETSP0098-20131031/18524_1 /ASSEMBLY_ACC=CAM_ASM_000208 /TAXON_ID=96639 /ORGANISM=" , Strain NY0313808BC1" /LENGTH=498 /DNA_ID=CAMNT_0050661923 /DNA_START=1521 /DNA_END=3017 /DNA_ORIENTATION=+
MKYSILCTVAAATIGGVSAAEGYNPASFAPEFIDKWWPIIVGTDVYDPRMVPVGNTTKDITSPTVLQRGPTCFRAAMKNTIEAHAFKSGILGDLPAAVEFSEPPSDACADRISPKDNGYGLVFVDSYINDGIWFAKPAANNSSFYPQIVGVCDKRESAGQQILKTCRPDAYNGVDASDIDVCDLRKYATPDRGKCQSSSVGDMWLRSSFRYYSGLVGNINCNRCIGDELAPNERNEVFQQTYEECKQGKQELLKSGISLKYSCSCEQALKIPPNLPKYSLMGACYKNLVEHYLVERNDPELKARLEQNNFDQYIDENGQDILDQFIPMLNARATMQLGPQYSHVDARGLSSDIRVGIRGGHNCQGAKKSDGDEYSYDHLINLVGFNRTANVWILKNSRGDTIEETTGKLIKKFFYVPMYNRRCRRGQNPQSFTAPYNHKYLFFQFKDDLRTVNHNFQCQVNETHNYGFAIHKFPRFQRRGYNKTWLATVPDVETYYHV